MILWESLSVFFLFFALSRAATDSFEAAVVRAVPVGSWSQLSQTDPCETSWPGIGCTRLGNTYHITSIRVQNETSQTVSKLLSFVSRIPYLESLRISNTVGTFFTLPESMGNLWKLKRLEVTENGARLRGEIPVSIGNLTELQRLVLSGNELEGRIPESVCLLSSLVHLDLRENRLSGSIPSCISSLKQLNTLDFRLNRLTGEIPLSLFNLTSLQTLRLGRNLLHGPLSSHLGHLRRLRSVQPNMKTVQHEGTSSDGTSDTLAINAGGPDHRPFQADNVFVNTSVGYFLANPTCSSTSASWAISLSGTSGSSRIISTNSTINVTNAMGIDRNFVASNTELYTTARVGGDSITYYGRCMKPGRYMVELHFVELEEKLAGRRVFDVFVQNTLIRSKLDIVGTTGSGMVPLVETEQAEISNDGSLKIELRATGSLNSSNEQYRGPTISAIRAYSNKTSGSGSKKTRVLWAVLGTCIGILVIVCVGVFTGLVCWLRRVEKRVRKAEDRDEEDEELHITDINSLSKSSNLVLFEYSELVEFTEKFSSDNLLGQGAHGKVFKGVLPDGRLVAIKQLVHRTPTCRRWFHHELQVINSVRHRNLVPLIGCCIDRGFPLLVCEYMPNGSLQNALFSKESNIVELLTWELRCQIALDVARGLQYLHEDCSNKMKIIHRDVKPGNILLDQEMRAHISDFGLAKFIEHDQQDEFVVSSVMGTRGYLAPEYVLNGQLSDKVDVYSYGIVLLEIVSGRKGMQTSMNLSMPEPVSIDEWAWEALTSDHISSLADSRLKGEYPLDEIVRLVQIAMWCTQGLPEMRPSMGQVTQMLEKQIGVPELPSERMSWEDFKDIVASNTFGTTNSSIWETMNGSTVSGGYHTALTSTLPDPITHEGSSVDRHSRS